MKKAKVRAMVLGLTLTINIFLLAKYLDIREAHALDHERLQRQSEKLAALDRSSVRFDFLEFMETASRYKSPQFHRILKSTFQTAQKYRLNPYLVLSLIYLESGFNPLAVSSKGACGLMQINFAVWKEALGLEMGKIFNIDYNIEHGCRILRHYMDESGGNLARALHLYNNGYMENGNTRFSQLVLEGKFKQRVQTTAG